MMDEPHFGCAVPLLMSLVLWALIIGLVYFVWVHS